VLDVNEQVGGSEILFRSQLDDLGSAVVSSRHLFHSCVRFTTYRVQSLLEESIPSSRELMSLLNN
jgi:hypothetical protein